MKYYLLMLAISLAPFSIRGQHESLPEVSIRDTEVREIKSVIVEDMTYEIHVALPRAYAESTDSYPVVYYLDAYYWGGIVIETYRLLRAFNEIPPLILVGISYKDASGQEAGVYRSRDFIPTLITAENTGAYSNSIPPASGGSSAFLRFIKEELKPMIAGKYRTKEDEAGILGISLGALFASYVLFHEPEVFDKYLLGSPRLDRDDFVTLEFEETYYAKIDTLPATVFLSAGTEEWEFIVVGWMKLRDRLQERNYQGLDLIVKAFEGENHTSGIPATISRGFRALYGRK